MRASQLRKEDGTSVALPAGNNAQAPATLTDPFKDPLIAHPPLNVDAVAYSPDALLASPLKNNRLEQLRYWSIVFGTCCIAIVCGSTNAFDFFSSFLQGDLELSSVQLSILAAFGYIGLYFMIPAGMCIDHFGPVRTTLIGMVMMIAGYLGFSFLPKGYFALMLICYALVGFGSGAAFMCALNVGVKLSPGGGGISVACVSCTMSLSIVFSITYVSEYATLSGCTENACWRQYWRVLVIGSSAMLLIGAILLTLFKEHHYPHLTTPLDIFPDPIRRPVNVRESLRIFKHGYFWVLFWSYFIGIGSSLFVLAHASEIWATFRPGPELAKWGDRILPVYSYTNAFMNVAAGLIADWLNRTNRMSHATFVAVFEFIFGLDFLALGVLTHMEVHNSLVVNFMISLTGVAFGTFLVMFPIITSATYGVVNFAKYFAYMQLATSLCSVVVPVSTQAVFTATGSFEGVHFTFAGLMFLMGLLLILVPRHGLPHEQPDDPTLDPLLSLRSGSSNISTTPSTSTPRPARSGGGFEPATPPAPSPSPLGRAPARGSVNIRGFMEQGQLSPNAVV